MNFFTELSAISEGIDLTIRIKGKNGKLTLSILPETVDKIQPLVVTNTPEWLDEHLITEIKLPLHEAAGVINAEDFSKSVKALADKKSEKPKAATPSSKPADKKKAKPAASKPVKAAPKKDAKPKPEPKKEEPAPEGPKQLSIV